VSQGDLENSSKLPESIRRAVGELMNREGEKIFTLFRKKSEKSVGKKMHG